MVAKLVVYVVLEASYLHSLAVFFRERMDTVIAGSYPATPLIGIGSEAKLSHTESRFDDV